jgi:PIN domain nuclease of toxin-antitoxin system
MGDERHTEFLLEIGRIRSPVADVWEILNQEHRVDEATGDVREIARHARLLGWTRDPFDRFIVAHALASNAILLTADETIRGRCSQALWGD